MEQHINFITLGVADLAASRRFYRDVFGWRETADSNANIAFFSTGNALLFALFAGFAGKNVQIVKAPQKVFWGGYSGYLAAPDGFLWEIAYNPFLRQLR